MDSWPTKRRDEDDARATAILSLHLGSVHSLWDQSIHQTHGDVMKVHDHKSLVVWQSAMELVVLVYKLAARLPNDERFALGNQLHRAAVSVPANIAEGNARVHRGECVYHLSVARGSLSELDTLLTISESLGYLAAEDLVAATELIDRIRCMLHRLLSALRYPSTARK